MDTGLGDCGDIIEGEQQLKWEEVAGVVLSLSQTKVAVKWLAQQTA